MKQFTPSFIRALLLLTLTALLCRHSAQAQNWSEIIKVTASDRESEDRFGYSVAISGDYAIVGAYEEDEDALGGNTLDGAGSAYLFHNQAGTWTQVQKIVASDRDAGDRFGYSVAISGDYAVVGAYNEDEDALGGNSQTSAGSAYIFHNQAGTWTQMQKIVAPDRKAFDWFGYSVAISGDYAVVGAQREGDDILSGSAILSSGSAYIFYNQAGTWTQVQKIVASDRAPSDFFGYSVAISGDYVVVGADSEDEDASGGNTLDRAGSAYLFYNQAGTWTQVQKIVASDRETTDFFGSSVAISGDYVLVGAYNEDQDALGGNTLDGAGSAYLFHNQAGTWTQVQKIVASDRDAFDSFGSSVAISGDYALVGAPRKDEYTSGGNSLPSAGSAYIFHNQVGIWTQVQKINASDLNTEDRFGISVAISGDYALVGAHREDEDASGGNSLSNSGSAYFWGKSCTNTAGTDLQTACDSYTWIDGNTYTASNNTATHTLINAAGCDSLVTLDLTINTIDVNVTDSSPTLTANALGATYQWLDCDNGYAAIAGATNQSFLATADGNYAVAVTANNCTDTSACYSVVITGIVENGNTAFASVYPNPTSGILTIDLGNTPLTGGITIELTDMLGRVVIRDQVSVPHIEVDLRKEENGVYVIRIITEAGAHALRVIKQ